MDTLFSVTGKVALVTGGSRGIGEMIAEGFLANGMARVYVTARKASDCEATAARLGERYQGECVSLPADISSAEQVTGLAAEMSSRESRLDVLVNNAGAAWGAPIDEFPEAGWDKVMDVNVKAMFFLTQALLPLIRAAATAAEPARVINIGSVDGIRVPLYENYSYSASKGAVHQLTHVLAGRLARENINVNAIAPGPFESRMMSGTLAEHGERIVARIPKGRIGEPEDMAGVAVFLASRASAYTTGAIIPCDGGLTTAT